LPHLLACWSRLVAEHNPADEIFAPFQSPRIALMFVEALSP